MPEYLLALDAGTTSSRALLFNRAGEVVSSAQHEFPQLFPAPGWVEHDPDALLSSQLRAAADALAQAGAGPRDVHALGIANQRETTVVWDRATGKPVANAIVWQDRRTAALCGQLRDAGAEPMVRAKTGLLLDPYFAGTKLAWILDNVPGARARAEAGELAFGTVDSWLVWHLTGGRRHVTDPTNAARTLLFSIVDGRWDPDLLQLLRIPASLLPEVVPSSHPVGRVAAPPELEGIEIAGLAGDQQAALFGQLCTAPGDAKNTYGTGCFLLQHIGSRFRLSGHRLLTTLACSPPGDGQPSFALEGSIFVGGAVVQWLRDNLRFFGSSAEVEDLAASVPDSAGLYLVPAFTGLGAPHWDPHAGGLLIGLERGTGIPHIARAALESIAFQVADVLRAMERDAPEPFRELRVDGGAAANDLLLQFQADLLGIPVRRPAHLETTALGAAYLAGLATGFWSGLDEIRRHRTPDRLFTPQAAPADIAGRLAQWNDAVTRSLGWRKPPR